MTSSNHVVTRLRVRRAEYNDELCGFAADEIERLTRVVERLSHESGFAAIKEAREENDRLRAALERITCLPKYEPVTTAKEIAYEALHPGYIIGDHWLEVAYDRICAGDQEAEVMRDYGYERTADKPDSAPGGVQQMLDIKKMADKL